MSPVSLACMVEMGFETKDIQEALYVCRNNPMVACEWLCGDREGAIFEAETGFPRGSSIVTKLIENPHFQLGLESPKMFMGKYLNDIVFNSKVIGLNFVCFFYSIPVDPFRL